MASIHDTDKHETSRFGGEGQCFKAKLIGILEVSEARGDRMCQEALSDLKMAIRAAGEHKQRITVHIALDGLRLRDEKTGDCLYHHPVHKISFIAQDMTDSRAFGYIFGSPDTGHRFFGIKTDKAASQVVIAMRDLFQVVFALKKKEIEIAKQHLEKNCLYNSPLFSDSSSTKSVTPELPAKYEAIKIENKASCSLNETKMSGTAVANLVDLQLELNSLQQGLHQMEKITPSEPFGSRDDPFGDSFTSFPNPILPPPPSSGKERLSRTSDSSSIFSPKTPHTADSLTSTSGMESYPFTSFSKTDFKFSRDFSSSHEEPSSGEWFTPSNSLFEESSLVSDATQKSAKDEKLERTKREILSQFDVFTDLDPLELKNPPKKILNDLVTQNQNQNENKDGAKAPTKSLSGFDNDLFGEDPFVSMDPFAETEFKQDLFEKDFMDYKKESRKNDTIIPGLLSTSLSKSPNVSILSGTSPKNVKFSDDRIGEGEQAPDPPPRPDAAVIQIKPPPLPPKKQNNDLAIKPPPRPSYMEDSLYDYMDNYESGSNQSGIYKSLGKSPALPIPMRKPKFENDFSVAPERPAKQMSAHSFEDDYLTPVQLTKPSEFNVASTGGILLPPPVGKSPISNRTALNGTSKQSESLDGLDITLSQLTLSGLNELATKLSIPPNQLSNMTLVQLTEFLSNVLKSKSAAPMSEETEVGSDFPTFKADFESNFSSSHMSNGETFDRYAVFRELINDEIKQTKIDTEPEEFKQEEEEKTDAIGAVAPNETEDRYAALREIVERDLLKPETAVDEKNENDTPNGVIENEVEKDSVKVENELNKEDKVLGDTPYISYNENEKVDDDKNGVLVKSPVKAPLKSPIPSAITEIIQTNVRLNSGSLSDIVSGSSPEVDNTMSNSDVGYKATDTTGESWAIFDQANIPQEVMKEKQATQSEEGLSPWSSDSKDGNGSPSDYRRGDSESGGDNWLREGGRKPQEGWWDTSAEPEMPYSSSNRRSTDSYEEEYYECYDKPRRRRQGAWSGSHAGSQAFGGHSSSSRDVSPWEEEPKRRGASEGRGVERVGWNRSSKHERHRERRPTDSWDDDDEYEYKDPRRFYWNDKFGARESDRHSTGSRDNDSEPRERWSDEWSDDRRRRRRDTDRDHWCCADWEEEDLERPQSRYGSTGRWSSAGTPPGKWRDRKHDDRYYGRDESPWDDEYPKEKEEIHSSHYIGKKNWRRPNSASEMERKSGEFKSRHLGGSDGERDRRYKMNRRSRSRDSHYSEPPYRHKPDTSSLTRNIYKGKAHGQYSKPQFELDFPEVAGKRHPDGCHLELGAKKTFTLQNRKKKDSPKSEENTNTFPRKSSKSKQNFENNFQPETQTRPPKGEFENDFQAEPESLKRIKTGKLKQQQSMIADLQRKPTRDGKPRGFQSRSKSLFEDDFSMDKMEHAHEDNIISVIKEEVSEENDSFQTNFEQPTNSNRLSKRLSVTLRTDLKKSESVNIFARENDPFDDDFFCESSVFDDASDKKDLQNGEHKWTDDYNS